MGSVNFTEKILEASDPVKNEQELDSVVQACTDAARVDGCTNIAFELSNWSFVIKQLVWCNKGRLNARSSPVRINSILVHIFTLAEASLQE